MGGGCALMSWPLGAPLPPLRYSTEKGSYTRYVPSLLAELLNARVGTVTHGGSVK